MKNEPKMGICDNCRKSANLKTRWVCYYCDYKGNLVMWLGALVIVASFALSAFMGYHDWPCVGAFYFAAPIAVLGVEIASRGIRITCGLNRYRK